MLHPRVLFLGDPAAAAPYVGLAKKLARETFASRIRNKTYTVGSATIRVENTLSAKEAFGQGFEQTFGGISKVWIQAGGSDVVYQWIGSGPYLYLDVPDTLNPSGYLPRGYGTCLQPKGANFLTRPLYSNIEEDTETPQRWAFFYSWYREVSNQIQLKVRPAHQPDGMGVHQWFPLVGNDWLLTTWAQSHPCSGIGSYGFYEAGYAIDVTYDYPPVLFRSSVGRFYSIPANWWRSGCTQIFNNQTYLIFTDVDSLFYAVSLSDTATIKTAAAPWPYGISLPPVGEGSGMDHDLAQREIIPAWRFNHTGTRAACIVAQRQEAWSDGTYTSSLYDGTGTYQWDIQHDAPALVEVDLVIDDGPFAFSVTLRQSQHSLTQAFIPAAVDYSLAVTGITDNSLVVLGFEHYVNPISMTSYNTTYSLDYAYHPHKATLGIVKTQDPTTSVWTTQKTFLAYYLAWDNSFNQTQEFTPGLLDFSEINPALIEGVYKNNFCFITQIHSIELSSLSLVMCATAWTEYLYKFYIEVGVTEWRSSYSEAFYTQVIAFNAIDASMSEFGGHPTLSAVLPDMLNRADGSYPDLETGYSSFPASSTIAYRSPSTVEYGAVKVVVDNGSETITGAVVGCERIAKQVPGGGGFANITNCPLFSSDPFVAIPQHFLFFDSVPSVRPGMTLDLATPELFEDYPAGLVHHENVHALVMGAMSVKGRIRTHPSGSYSLWFGPIAANKRLITFISSVGDIANDYDQTILDKIFFKFKDQEVTTSHVAETNTAFGKTWSLADYYYQLSLYAGTIFVDPQVTTYPETYKYYLRYPTQYYIYPMGVSHATFHLQTLNDYGNVGYFTIQSSAAALHEYFADETPMPAQEAIFHYGRDYRIG